MYKVCIADDEPFIRKGIAERIKKAPFPFLIVGQAQTGEEALSLYRKEKPDLFFLDIKMPGLNGLETIEAIRKEDRSTETKFIIISGYDDFAYMQKAIHVNVEDYVKKPIQPEEFLKTLEKVYEKLEEESLARSKKRMKSRLLLWSDFYEVKKRGSVKGSFLLLYKKNMMNQEQVWNLTERFPVEKWKYLWFNSTNHIILLYSEYDYTPEEIRLQVQREVKQGIYVVYFNGNGMLDQILSAMEEELNGRLYPLPPRFYVCGESSGEKWEYDRRMLELTLEEGQRSAAKKIIADSLEEVFDNTESIHRLSGVCREMLTAFSNAYSRRGILLPSTISSRMQPMYLANYDGKEEVKAEFAALAEELCAKVEEAQTKSEVVDQVIRYMESHYSEDLTLTSLANEFFLAPTYLARKFKSKTDKSVMHYLEEYRIERAEEMLRDSALSITEVANRCGYSDPNYFSRVFRKVKGISPKDCRK